MLRSWPVVSTLVCDVLGGAASAQRREPRLSLEKRGGVDVAHADAQAPHIGPARVGTSVLDQSMFEPCGSPNRHKRGDKDDTCQPAVVSQAAG